MPAGHCGLDAGDEEQLAQTTAAVVVAHGQCDDVGLVRDQPQAYESEDEVACGLRWWLPAEQTAQRPAPARRGWCGRRGERPGLRWLLDDDEVAGESILEFSLGPSITNTDLYQESGTTVSGALSSIPQHAFGGNLEGFRFTGTNVIMEKDRIIFIKDDSPSEWSDDAAEKDVQSVLAPHRRGQK